MTSHVFRKTAAPVLDGAGLTDREIADQRGHAQVSMTQNRYLGRRAVSSSAAEALERAHHDRWFRGRFRPVSGTAILDNSTVERLDQGVRWAPWDSNPQPTD